MPLNNLLNIQPNDITISINSKSSIRKKWIQNLIDLLYFSLLKDDLVRAKRAWSILVRCREVNWKSRWYWGLLLLSTSNNEIDGSTQTSSFTQSSESRDIERWLNTLRVSAREEDKPSLLHALVLNLIKSGQYRHAYDQLETYLSSYPYLLSGPLHTYAGLLAFYLAQPASLRMEPGVNDNNDQSQIRGRNRRFSSISSSSSPPPMSSHQPPDTAGLRNAKGWFIKAVEINQNDEVAKQFISLIDNPNQKDNDDSDDDSDDNNEEKSDQRTDDEDRLSETDDDENSQDENEVEIEDGDDDDDEDEDEGERWDNQGGDDLD
ncbi:uncharacterized protein L201_007172 [Kwoniella dendrophila CBS 6074]|uniref:Uncharacterized protein n=1 Tax=Kwoniella dendrophila CBS 6074 TaxID=1295534 RepID=A0AAX4K641_9TREE